MNASKIFTLEVTNPADYAWWKMEESGNADRVDSIQSIHTIVSITAPGAASSVAGVIDDGMRLESENTLEFKNDAAGVSYSGAGMTQAGWFKYNQSFNTKFFGMRNNNAGEYIFGVPDYDGSSPRFRFSCTGAAALSITSPAEGVWIFFVLEIGASGVCTLEFNRSGTIYSRNATAPLIGSLTNCKALLQCPFGALGDYMEADEVGIFPRVLTGAERDYLYNSGAGRTSPIVFPP